MKKTEELNLSLRGKLMLSGTLAMFAMGTLKAEAATTNDKDKEEGKAPHTGTADVSVAEGQKSSQAVHKFDIPAGTVGQVLETLQKQSGIRIELASNHDMSGIASSGVHGVVTVQEALEQALASTGLSARFDTPDSVKVEMRGANESVVVTADDTPSSIKYTTPLVDLPQTVTVVSEQTMAYTASTTLVEALRTVPGITFGAGEGGNPLGDRPYIRGIDSQSSTYIDGVRDIAAQSRETFDIESIEVQEGPGGTYGGRSTGGGSINMNSRMARRKNFIAGTFMPGTANYFRGTVDGNWQISNLIAGRLTGMGHSADVNGRDAVHNQRWGIAPSLAIGLGRPTRLYLDYYHLITNNLPDSGVPYNNPAVPATIPANYGPQIYQRGDGSPLKLPRRGLFWGLKDRDHDKEYAKIATGRLEHDLWHEHALVRNTFRYDRTSQDYVWTLPDDSKGNILYGYLFRRINSRNQSTFTAANQTDLSGSFKTGSIKHTYAGGIEFTKERANVDTYANNTTSLTGGQENCAAGIGAASNYNCTSLFSPDFNDPWTLKGTIIQAHNPAHYVATSRSAYIFDTVQFNSHFQSTLGARYDHYQSDYASAKAAGTGAITTNSVTNNIGNYLGSLIYKPDHATSVYGSVSTSAIPPGASLAQGSDPNAITTIGNQNLQPQFIRQEEFGAKRELNGGRSLVRVDFYRNDIQNVRITQADGTVAAAGNSRTLGAQIGISGQLTRKWQATAGYGYIDAVLVNAGFTNGAPSTSNGTSMPNVARHSVSITSNYAITRHLRAGGGIYTMTKVWGSQVNNKWVPGYARVDIFGNYEINKHYSLQANIQNVGNTLYYQQAYPTHYAIPGVARSAVFGLNVKF